MTNETATPNKGGKFGQLERPKFKEPPRYRLLEKAFLRGVKVQRGRDWLPLDDVMLDPEEMPYESALAGPWGGRGAEPDRKPLLIEYEGIPDDHMEPVNEAAEWMLKNVDALKDQARIEKANKPKRRTRNPVDDLSIVGPDAVVLNPARDTA